MQWFTTGSCIADNLSTLLSTHTLHIRINIEIPDAKHDQRIVAFVWNFLTNY